MGQEYLSGMINGVSNASQQITQYSSLISVLGLVATVFLVVGLIVICLQMIRHERTIVHVTAGGIVTFVFSLCLMGLLMYILHMLRGVYKDNTVAVIIEILLWLLYAVLLLMLISDKEDGKNYFLVAILSILSGLGNSLVILCINIGITSDTEGRKIFVVFFLLGLCIYIMGQKLVRGKMIKLTNYIVYEKRMDITRKLLASNYENFESIDNSVITATITNDTNTISGFINVVITGLTNSIVLICCLIYLGTISLTALAATFVIIVFVATIYFFTGTYANKLGEQSRDLQNVFFGFIENMTAGMKELDLNISRKEMFHHDMDLSCKEYNKKVNKSALAFANMYVVGELIFTFALGFVVFLLPFIIKELNQGDITSYVFVLLYITGPVHGILEMIPSMISIRISNKRIYELLDKINVPVEKIEQGIEMNGKEMMELSLEDVEYEYSQDQKFHIGPISYQFRTGEITFITGGNGSGKSTLFKVLTGLYRPVKGKICVNGKGIANQDLRELFSAVTSDYHLFKKLYGIDIKGKEKEIEHYLDTLDLTGKVSIDDGIFSTIELSSGQRKRLALLTAYLEDKPFFIFDEWAAEQDREFREFFYNILIKKLKQKGKCVIAITHDDRYFNMADRILKLEMGQKVEVN